MGRPRVIQAPDAHGNVIVYLLSRGYGENGSAVLFYHTLKGVKR
jgi:hypothetical protein